MNKRLGHPEEDGARWYSDHALGEIGSGLIESRLAAAVRSLDRRGVPVKPGSRIWLAQKFLAEANASNDPLYLRSPEARDRAVHVHRTAFEVVTITYAADLHSAANHPFTEPKLRKLTEGAERELPSSAEARNIQFELYVAALLRLGGVAVYGGEPDLRILYGRDVVGVAAKRVRSLRRDQLERNVHDAVDQIERSHLPGFIALNIDAQFRDFTRSPSVAADMANMNDIFERTATVIRAHALNASVLGLLAFGYAVEWTSGSDANFRIIAPSRFERLLDSIEKDGPLFFQFSEKWRMSHNAELRRLWSPGPV